MGSVWDLDMLVGGPTSGPAHQSSCRAPQVPELRVPLYFTAKAYSAWSESISEPPSE